MATDWQTFPLEFKGGLISNLSPLQQGTNAIGSATILENFEPSLAGGYEKIMGFQKFNTSAVPTSGNIQCISLVSNNYTAVVVRNDKYHVVTSSAITQAHADNATNYAARSALSGAKVRFARYNFGAGEKTIFVDGVNAPAYYDGSQSAGSSVTFANASASAIVPVVGSSHVVEFKNHLVFGKGNKVIVGEITSDSNFTGSNALEINVKSSITGLIVFREQLIVFTKNSIQKMTGVGVTDFKLAPITENLGCIKPDTIQEVGGDILFYAPDGIRSLAATEKIGDFGLEVASKPIKKDIDGLSGTSFDSYVIREKGQYRLLAFSAFTVNESEGLIATKFVDQGGAGLNWSKTKGIKSYVSDSRYYGEAGSVAEMILFAHTDGYIYQGEATSAFDTANIKAIFESPFMPINDPTIRKTFYKCGLYLDPSGAISLSLNIKYDQGEASIIQPPPVSVVTTGTGLTFFNSIASTYDSDKYSADFNKLYNNAVVGSGKTVAIRIEEESVNPSFRLDTAVLEYSAETRQ